MAKRHNEKHSKKVRNLVAFCSLCAIFLAVSTYAWFIGMKTVNVSKFDINIATTEGLFLSMDGQEWSYNLDVTQANQYENNANTFAPNGLIPMSTVGDMDTASSRMKLYEKASLTATPGGYRLLSSQVENNVNTVETSGEYIEGDGYVAFDLFIKNLSGEEYYVENNPLNEEAIYLTTNSEVKVSDAGGVANAGIENSVRVAFAQIGRVKADTADIAKITGITCTDTEEEDDTKVTGICRSAQIWEPNDASHVQNALNWYNESCLSRKATPDGDTVTDSNSYNPQTEPGTTTCKVLNTTTAYPTYAISRDITVDDQVNIYDGAAYNTYEANTIDYQTYAQAEEEEKTDYKLVDFPYFTDTMKEKAGVDRPTFMTLAPNSITKVRVYVYIEGQDIDNYDFASLGAKISVNFGFTKERYTEEDVDYDGPSTDITPDSDTENSPNTGGGGD